MCIDTPSWEQRLQCCLRQTKILLAKYMRDGDIELFATLCMHILIEKNYSVLNSETEQLPETHIPKPGRKRASTGSKKSAPLNASTAGSDAAISTTTDSSENFSSSVCIEYLVGVSVNWSYRDITKTLQSIQCEVLGTNKYVQ